MIFKVAIKNEKNKFKKNRDYKRLELSKLFKFFVQNKGIIMI